MTAANYSLGNNPAAAIVGVFLLAWALIIIVRWMCTVHADPHGHRDAAQDDGEAGEAHPISVQSHGEGR